MNRQQIYRHNFLYGTLEVVFFVWAISMIDPSTVLPLFITLISGSPIIIGFMTTIFNGGSALPQIFFYRYTEKKENKKALFIRFAILRSSTWILMALFIVLFPHKYILLQYLLILVVFLFTFFLSIEDMAWSYVISKVIDPKRRGSFLGIGSLWGNLLAVGGGFFIKWLLSPSSPLLFPYNFAFIFFLSSLFFFLSVFVFSFLKMVDEEVEKREAHTSPFREVFHILKNDTNFLRYIVVNFFLNAFLLSLPFFLLYGRGVFSIPDKEIGFFVASQTIGRALFVYLTGKMGDVLGHKYVLILVNIMAFIVLVLALITHWIAFFIPVRFVFYVIFFISGAVLSGKFVSSTNYLLDIAPSEKVPAFRGISNSIISISLLIFPTMGGFILKYTSYTTLFVVSLFFVAISTLLSFTLRDP